MAETYHVLDIDALPIPLFATLAAGLREDSRSKSAQRGDSVGVDTMLAALAVDNLSTIAWLLACMGSKTKPDKPKSVFDTLTKQSAETGGKEALSFESGEDFENYRKKLLEG